MDKKHENQQNLTNRNDDNLARSTAGASAYELGEKGISAADAKLYSQIGYDSTGRYEYLNGRAQDSWLKLVVKVLLEMG